MGLHRIIDLSRDELAAACATFGVKRLEAFGSVTREDFDESRSDLDFLVEFLPGPVEVMAERYFGLLGRLERIFGRPVDLIMRSAVRNPYVGREIDRTREPVYVT